MRLRVFESGHMSLAGRGSAVKMLMGNHEFAVLEADAEITSRSSFLRMCEYKTWGPCECVRKSIG